MYLRKFNAALSLLLTLLLLLHASFHSLYTLSCGRIAIPQGILPWALTGVMAVHALISLEMAVSAMMEAKGKKGKSYPALNLPTILQRASGVLLILFTALHIAGASGYMQPPQFVHAVLPPLFFTVSLLHAAVSTSKACITLGLGNRRAIKIIDISVKAVCAITCVAAIGGFYYYIY